ncbi:MAG: tetratricopeptide repeat protein [Candidatus Korobacteraceae bacterium]
MLRLPGARGGVYAFSDDLAEWMANRKPGNSVSVAGMSGQRMTAVESGSQSDEPASSAIAVLEHSENTELALAAPAPDLNNKVRKAWLLPLSVALLLVAAAGVAVFRYQRHVPASLTDGKHASAPQLATHHEPNPQAHDLYLKGRYYWNQRTPSSLNQALNYFNQAIATDPDYAQAYVGLADCFNLLREYAAMPEQEAYGKAIAAARKAIALDNSLAEAHNSLAFDLFYGLLDATGAEKEFQQALSLDPNCELAHHWYATYLMTLGRNREALQQIEMAQQLNLSSTSIVADKGLILYYGGKTDEATVLLKQLIEADPSFISTHRYLALIDLTAGRYDEYLAEARKVAVLSKNDTELAIVDAAGKGLHTGGPQRMLESMLGVEKTEYAEGRIPAFRLAETSSLMGQRREALSYLQVSRERRESALSMVLVDPPLKTLRDDPSYRELVIQVGLPQLASS